MYDPKRSERKSSSAHSLATFSFSTVAILVANQPRSVVETRRSQKTRWVSWHHSRSSASASSHLGGVISSIPCTTFETSRTLNV